MGQVILLHQINLHILESLCIEELLDDQFGTVQHIGCNLEALLQAQLLLQVFPFPLLDAMIIHLRNTRTLLQLDLQPNRIVLDLIGHDLHIGKEAMLPEAFDRCRDLVTRYRDFVTYRQTGESYQHKIIIILHTRHLNVRNLVFAGRQRVRNLRQFCRFLNIRRIILLCKQPICHAKENKKQHYSLVHSHAIVYNFNCSLVLPNRRSRCW